MRRISLSNMFMTKRTNRNNIKKMLRFVTEMVMVISRLLSTRAFQCIRRRNVALTNGIIDSVASLDLFRVLLVHKLCALECCYSTFRASIISQFNLLAFFRRAVSLFGLFPFLTLLVFSFRFCVDFMSAACFQILATLFVMANFALRSKAAFVSWFFVKLRDLFNCFTLTANFCYDLLSHSQLLISWLWLEPVAAQSVTGSLNYNTQRGGVK